MDLVELLYGIGFVQGVVLAGILLYARSGHRLANAIMAALVLVTAANLLQKLMILSGVFYDYPQFALLNYPLRYTWGPLLYLYALSLTGGQLSHRQWWHFLPAIVYFLASSPGFWQADIEHQRMLLSYLWNPQGESVQETMALGGMGSFWSFAIEFQLGYLFFALQLACYCTMVLRRVADHNRRLQLHFSSLEHMTLRWLRALAIACLGYLALLLLFNRFPVLLIDYYDASTLLANLHSILLVVLFYTAAVKALLQPSLIRGVAQAMDSEPFLERHFEQTREKQAQTEKLPEPQSEPEPQLEPQPQSEPQPTEVDAGDLQPSDLETAASPAVEQEAGGAERQDKYRRSKLSTEDAQRYKIKLIEIMQDEALYLSSDLTLPELAETAGLTAPQVSQVLNGQMNQNFFSFVNNYRVEAARGILLDPETSNMPIVDLALEVGFKSKSSFYDAFKRATHMTPTQFKRTMAQSSAVDDRAK